MSRPHTRPSTCRRFAIKVGIRVYNTYIVLFFSLLLAAATYYNVYTVMYTHIKMSVTRKIHRPACNRDVIGVGSLSLSLSRI